MIISGHQPCYLPWLGVFHKLELCDVFVYMDTVQYLTNDWNNRNKVRVPDGAVWLTVPVEKHRSAGSNLDQVAIATGNGDHSRRNWQHRHWETIKRNYKKADYFSLYEAELEEMYLSTVWTNLVSFCWTQFNFFRKYFHQEQKTVVRMSEISFAGKKSDLILAHCLKFSADGVVLGANGRSYVNLEKFRGHNIRVHFQEYHHPVYGQRFPEFVPRLSALDLLLNHGPESRDILMKNNITYSELRTGQHWVSGNE